MSAEVQIQCEGLTMTHYEDYMRRGKIQHGERFSEASLAPQFIAAYNSGERITVAFVSGNGEVYEVRRGTVGVTTGWVPCFLLMGRKTDHGSSYTLSAKDCIVSMDAWREYKRSHVSASEIPIRLDQQDSA